MKTLYDTLKFLSHTHTYTRTTGLIQDILFLQARESTDWTTYKLQVFSCPVGYLNCLSMREEHLLVQNLMFLTITTDCCIILGGIGTAKLITYTMSFEDLENFFSSLPQERITVIWGVLCPFPQKMPELVHFYLSNDARPRHWPVSWQTESLQEKSSLHIPVPCFWFVI